MYDYLDRPVTSLDHGGRFLVWSTRSWVKAVGERQCPASAIARAFDKWNMVAGLQPFLRMMALFNRHGLENFQFCALQCNHVSEHEAIIIALVSASRGNGRIPVRGTLDLLVEEDAVGDLFASIASLGQAMALAGLVPVRTGADADEIEGKPETPMP
ncbi:MAG: hypothetical protein K2W91_14860 [Novosphingobium sp.]|uniref:hypothetical protein n=1 Tax=Novosphingobium sp. CCH12-A3 TaxID=1768752 RepID=UPI0007835BCC|nr:hypothetical protein [Novosphingobium sp. CCH12-A3]MBX9645363.1 hypothetical protein [Novosphingobium sp.]